MSPQRNQAASCDPATAAEFLRQSSPLRPKLALVLGSGFGGVLDGLTAGTEISYNDVPGFPHTSVGGHAGRLLLAELNGVPLLVMQGRAHYYEGCGMDLVTFPVRAMAEFGIKDLVLTNAAGGINREFNPGDFMLLTDHINFMGTNPLLGTNPEEGPRFVDLSEAYDPGLRDLLSRAAEQAHQSHHTGVYLAVSGPSYETPAEIRAFACLGADAVGMSTVPEAIVARQRGIRVAGISCITNMAAGIVRQQISHEEVLAAGQQIRGKAANWLKAFLSLYGKSE